MEYKFKVPVAEDKVDLAKIQKAVADFNESDATKKRSILDGCVSPYTRKPIYEATHAIKRLEFVGDELQVVVTPLETPFGKSLSLVVKRYGEGYINASLIMKHDKESLVDSAEYKILTAELLKAGDEDPLALYNEISGMALHSQDIPVPQELLWKLVAYGPSADTCLNLAGVLINYKDKQLNMFDRIFDKCLRIARAEMPERVHAFEVHNNVQKMDKEGD
jgi:hypothetical protein